MKFQVRKDMSPKYSLNRYLLLLGLILGSTTTHAEDWPQLLGPERDGVYRGRDLAPSWPESGLPILWQKKVGKGFSNPAVVDSHLILFHRIGDKEVVEALGPETGSSFWSFGYPTTYHDDFGFDDGPRASPIIAEGRLYTFGAQGMLHCLELGTGRKIWSVDTHSTLGVKKGFFGAAGSPLLQGKAVFLNAGGRSGAGLAAFDKDTGKLLWTAADDEASYASPIAATFGDKLHILFFTRSGLVGTDSRSGEVLFRFPWRSRNRASVNAATPLSVDDLIFLSASYRTGAVVLRVKGRELEQLWSSDEALSNHYATSIHHEGHLYGFHGRQEYGPSLRCVDLKTGKVRWSQDRFGSGTVALADDRLIILREKGELILAQADPKKYQQVSKARILTGTVRAYPALADGLLYARNQDTLVCVDLKKK